MEQQELIDSGVADISASLGLGSEPEDKTTPDMDAPDSPESPDAAPEGEAPPEGTEDAPPAEEATASAKAAPKSWAREMHEEWAKLTPKAQEYIEKRENQIHEGIAQYREHHTLGKTLNDVISPYRPMIQAAGIDEAKAVATLLNAHYRLTQGSPEQRRAVWMQLGQDIGVAAPQQGAQEQDVPPAVRQLMERQAKLEQALTQRQRADYEQARSKASSEVDAFAKDHPYLDEVATEIAIFIDHGDDLPTAYEKAVRANPVTWAKEQDRLRKEIELELRTKAKNGANAARLATAANVRGRDTTRTPTEPKGKFLSDDSMKEDLREILASRSTH